MLGRRKSLRPILGSPNPEARLDELDQNPNWPIALPVYLALEVAAPDAYASVLAANEKLAERIEKTLLQRLGPESCEDLQRAVRIFDLRNHTFTNQWPTHYFTTEKWIVESRIQGVIAHAKAFATALQAEPALFPPFREVAEVALAQYRLPKASGLFEILLEVLPAYHDKTKRVYIADCHFYLGMIRRLEQPEEATKHFQRFLELESKRCPNNNWPINPGYIPYMLHRPSSVRAWAELGRMAKNSGDISQARACFRRAIEIDGQSHEAPYYELGETFEKAGDIRKALREYRRALDVRKAALIDEMQRWSIIERPYRRELAELCLHMVPHVAAPEKQNLLRQALQLNPDDAQEWMHELEAIIEDAPTIERQVEYCTRAVRLGADIPNNDTAESGYRAKIYKRFLDLFIEIAESFLSERRGYTKTLAWYRKARKICGGNPELLLRQIELVAKYQRDHWQVIDLCDRVLAQVPNHPQALLFKERALEETSR